MKRKYQMGETLVMDAEVIDGRGGSNVISRYEGGNYTQPTTPFYETDLFKYSAIGIAGLIGIYIIAKVIKKA